MFGVSYYCTEVEKDNVRYFVVFRNETSTIEFVFEIKNEYELELIYARNMI